MMDGKKRSFDDDDLFNRKPYAKFLKNLILNCDNYHRNDDVQAYTIALDSPWGTGKSIFLEKLESMLEKDCEGKLHLVHYNAWKNDFWSNAFEPFADEIFSNPLFASPLADQTKSRAIKKLVSAIKNLAISFAKKPLEYYFDAEYVGKAEEDFECAVSEYISNNPNAISPAYSTYKENIKEMQDAMETALYEALPGGKLVIIIDELDRCKPLFAVETLEIVKHIMDVPNVIYVFALDIQQLGAVIKKVYGTETDATGYLMRFFSYYSRLPEIDLQAFIGAKLKNVKEIKNMSTLVNSLASISKWMQLSARDIDTIGNVYKLMIEVVLKYYHNQKAYILYWFLLCQKYKYPLRFSNQMDGLLSIDEKSIFFTLSSNPLQKYLVSVLHQVENNSSIKNLVLTDEESNPNSNWYIKDVRVDPEGTIDFRICQDKESYMYKPIRITNESAIAGFLFYPDLFRWDEIKDLTPGQFLLRQMEMFNFLPTIE